MKDGSTVVFKREITSLDGIGQPLEIDGPTSATEEVFTYEADRYFLTSAEIPAYSAGTSPYDAQEFDDGAGALGLRSEFRSGANIGTSNWFKHTPTSRYIKFRPVCWIQQPDGVDCSIPGTLEKVVP